MAGPCPTRSGGRDRADEVVRLADAEAVAEAAAQRLLAIARAAVAARGRFAVALSGGATPRALFRRLAAEPYRSAVPWPRTDVFWADERPVRPTDPESNHAMARATLLDAVPVPPERVHRIPAERSDLDAVASAYEAELARTLGARPGGPPPALDLVLLGLGADGHTASLFPGSPALAETRRWVVANPVPALGTTRVTLTLPVLNRAAHAVFLVTGPDKARALQAVLEGPHDPARLPAQAVRPAGGGPLWLVDQAAGAALAGGPADR
jgi:6-phosphogluconolactonase